MLVKVALQIFIVADPTPQGIGYYNSTMFYIRGPRVQLLGFTANGPDVTPRR